VEVFAGPEQEYLVTVDQLEAAVTDRTKVLLFVSPSNPTGSVYSPEQVAEIGKWAAAKGLWVVTDEIYEHLTYDGVPFTSIATAAPELGDKVVILNGVAKTYAMTGWRVGWAIAPPDLAKALTSLQSHQTSNVANVSQMAALAAVTGDLARRRCAVGNALERLDVTIHEPADFAGGGVGDDGLAIGRPREAEPRARVRAGKQAGSVPHKRSAIGDPRHRLSPVRRFARAG
jgi:aspartate/methionine/tyrosine aminotransferase